MNTYNDNARAKQNIVGPHKSPKNERSVNEFHEN